MVEYIIVHYIISDKEDCFDVVDMNVMFATYTEEMYKLLCKVAQKENLDVSHKTDLEELNDIVDVYRTENRVDVYHLDETLPNYVE